MAGDEPDTPAEIASFEIKLNAIDEAGAKASGAIIKQSADLITAPFDYPNFTIDAQVTNQYIQDIVNGVDMTGEKTYANKAYYWQAMQENPVENRFLAGYFFWHSTFDGIFPFSYQAIKVSNPYNDFDSWSSPATVTPWPACSS